MTNYAWMSALAAAAGLVLAALAITRAAKSELSRPLALLAANQFAWNTATVFLTLTGDENWRWLGAVVAPLFPPAAWWFVLVFVGRSRSLRWLSGIIWGVYAVQTVVALVLLAVPSLAPKNPFGFLSLVHLAFDLPLLALGVWLILAYRRGVSDEAERGRARLLIIALVVFVACVSTDMLADAGLFGVALGAPGSFFFNAILFVLTYRMGAYSEADRAAGVATTVLAVLFVLVGYLAVFSITESSRALLVVGMASVTLAMFAFGRYALTSWTNERMGLERMATMGRFSAQMAHDLKNPLAAARGAAQFLEEEVKQGRGIAQQQEFMTLLIEQLDRLGRLIDRYQKLGKLEVSLQPLEANALVQKVLALQAFATQGERKLVTELSAQPLPFRGDGDLLASALENLVKNSIEAMPEAGQITVRTRAHDGAPGVELQVEDTGTGMDARAKASAFDIFKTTKAQGSGLGLHFVRQVARAHGGDAALWSELGRGTRVTIWLPLQDNPPATV